MATENLMVCNSSSYKTTGGVTSLVCDVISFREVDTTHWDITPTPSPDSQPISTTDLPTYQSFIFLAFIIAFGVKMILKTLHPTR